MKRRVYMQPEVQLGVGDKTAIIRKITIYMNSTGSGIDDFYGNMGQDIVANFDSFTLDFKTMTFSLGEPLSTASAGASAARKD